MNISGNTILITGGTSGIGKALALAFHDLGNQVIVTGRRQHLLDEVSESRPGIVGLRLDVSDPESLSLFTDDLRLNFPELNVLVANAGIASEEDLVEGWNIEVSEAMVQTNILGTLRVNAAILPMLMKQSTAAILVTTSNLAFVPRASLPTYCATKSFLHTWLESLRYQLRNTSVEVLEVAPPYVQTTLTSEGQATDPRGMPVTAFVEEVMAMIQSKCHPAGELLVERARGERWAEQNGQYGAIFSKMNPS
ncbi:SDR family oxidoreductase [Pseudomonas viridiflava]|uniref:SDR family oxidoreductase n=1 Tax=Pseudomonas viridiflava TaxID=33069 RepID=UPI000730B181|nr:SDR family NAD(P)-dependent oxidoreductase [Pseudomonas viridiflava]KTC22078.1 oxidoreductase [Pseudomonas marginalis ICMP 11289]VVN20635.1 putative oxidoreductase [Pseudomonas fluorescens]